LGVAFAWALVGFAAWRATNAVRALTRFNKLVEGKSQGYNLLSSNGQPVADRFLADVREGRLEAAYAATTPAFRERMGLAEFGEFVAENPALRKPLLAAGWKVGSENDVFARFELGWWQDTVVCGRPRMVHNYRAAPKAGGPGESVELVVVVEGSSVKVEQCTVARGGGAKP
jgi:hypothetical protein